MIANSRLVLHSFLYQWFAYPSRNVGALHGTSVISTIPLPSSLSGSYPNLMVQERCSRTVAYSDGADGKPGIRLRITGRA